MVLMHVKVVLKSASMKLGGWFVMIPGTLLMHRLCAINWDMPDKVDIVTIRKTYTSHLTNLL